MSKLKYNYNYEIFKEINTPISAYLFGYLWADGHITKNEIKACSKEQDVYMLKLCQKHIGGRFYQKSVFDKRFKKPNYIINQFQANSRKIIKDIITNNFRKDNTSIPDTLKNYFIRGFFDGDGCLYINKKHYLYQLSFSSANTDWKWLIDCIPEEIREGYSFSDNGIQIRWCGKRARKILDWIYTGEESLCLKRKREKYENNK